MHNLVATSEKNRGQKVEKDLFLKKERIVEEKYEKERFGQNQKGRRDVFVTWNIQFI